MERENIFKLMKLEINKKEKVEGKRKTCFVSQINFEMEKKPKND